MNKVDWSAAMAILQALRREAQARHKVVPAELLQRVAESPAEHGDELRKVFGDAPPLALVAFDTPGIQHYVFKVRRPVDLLGGSGLVANFTDPEAQHPVSLYRHLAGSRFALRESAVVFAGGGGGLLLVAASEAEGVTQALCEILRDATAGDLESVASSLAVWPEELSEQPASVPEGVAEVLGALAAVSRYGATLYALVAQRNGERSRSAPLRRPVRGERCHACGDHPAEALRTYRDQTEERLCQPCDLRFKHGRTLRDDDQQPRSFEDLVEGLDNTDLAVIYADGANVGRAFQLVRSMAEHRTLSLAVDGAMQKARRQALAASEWLRGEDNEHRAQYPICGGDDLVLVLPAQAVVDVVPCLIEQFEQAFDPSLFPGFSKELRQQLTTFGLGVGIAVAPFHFPIEFLVDYAYELLKSAKGCIRRGGQQKVGEKVRSAVDFLVLRSGTPLTTSIGKLRRHHARRAPENGRGGMLLTQLPLPAAEFVQQVRRARSLHQHVPTAQLQAMRREIRRGPELSRSLWRYQHARAKEGHGWAAWREVQGCALAQVDSLLWQTATPPADAAPGEGSGQGWWTTGYLDTLEILDLLPPTTSGDTP